MMRNKINNKCRNFLRFYRNVCLRGAHVAISFATMASSFCINFVVVRFFSFFSFSINQRFYIPNSVKHATNKFTCMCSIAHRVHHLTTHFSQFTTIMIRISRFSMCVSTTLFLDSLLFFLRFLLLFCFFPIIYGEYLRMNRIEMQLSKHDKPFGKKESRGSRWHTQDEKTLRSESSSRVNNATNVDFFLEIFIDAIHCRVRKESIGFF